ncbi:MAG: LolA family protein [Bradymonadaceae bacterium]
MKTPKNGRRHQGRRAGFLLAAGLLCGALAMQAPAGVAVAQEAPATKGVSKVADGARKDDVARAPAEMSAEDVARRINDFYKKTNDYQAAFKQTYTDIAAGDAKTSEGRVYFKTPGKMRWDYHKVGEPSKRDKVLVSDGSVFWIYEFEFQQVFKQCLAESQLPTSLRFLMGQGDLLEEFDVELTARSTAQRPELKLTPKVPTGQYRELRFILDPKSFQVTRTTIFDPYGNTNQIEFIRTQVNRNLPDSGFEFTPPKGARVLNPQKSCK